MNIHAYIFHYKRHLMATRCATELERFANVTVVDDCSATKPNGCRVITPTQHNGKKGFWRNWQIAFNDAKTTDADFFIFTADDLLNWRHTEIERGINKANAMGGEWVINHFRDQRNTQWNGQQPVDLGYFREIGFVDCAVIIPRSVMALMDWKVTPVPDDFHLRSSGVGYYMTRVLREHGVKILQPARSWVRHHGNDCSVMHGKRNFVTYK